MEYRSKYYSVEAIVFTGYNFKEVNDFTGNRLAWQSKEMTWDDSNPPADLKVIVKGIIPKHLNIGDYVVKLSSGKYMVYNKTDFESLFDKIEE